MASRSGQKVIFFEQRYHALQNAAGEEGAGVVDGITRLRDEHHIAWVNDGKGQMGDAVFGADGGENLFVGVDFMVLKAEAFGHEMRGRMTERGDAFVKGIAVIFWVVNRFGHFIDDEFMRGQIGVADAEVDDIFAGRKKGALLLVDLDEKVRGQH